MYFNECYDIFVNLNTDGEAEIAARYATMDDPYIVFENFYALRKGDEFIPISLVTADAFINERARQVQFTFNELEKCAGTVIEHKNDYNNRADADIIKSILAHSILEEESFTYEFASPVRLSINGIPKNLSIIAFIAG